MPLAGPRNIAIPSVDQIDSFVEFQRLYMDAQGWLIPHTKNRIAGELAIRINSLGCKGDELQPEVPVVMYLGDSTMIGVGPGSWTQEVNIPRCQALNAAVEGSNMRRLGQRLRCLRERIKPVGLVVYAGWNNLIYSKRETSYWHEALREYEGDYVLAFCNLATNLRPECRYWGYPPLSPRTVRINDVPEGYFDFWSPRLPTQENIDAILDGVARYNDFLADFCLRRGHILIDFYHTFLPESFAAMTRDFSDVCHFRSSMYHRVGASVHTAIAEPILRKLFGIPPLPRVPLLNPVSQSGYKEPHR